MEYCVTVVEGYAIIDQVPFFFYEKALIAHIFGQNIITWELVLGSTQPEREKLNFSTAFFPVNK